MRDSTHDAVIGLVADYCGFLREAAFLLATLAEAPDDERSDEFEALVGVHSESRTTYVALMHALAQASDDTGDPWVANARQLTRAVHDLFGGLVHAGSILVGWEAQRLPTAVVEQCLLVESTSSSLAGAWQTQHDPVAAERHLWSVRLGVAAIDQALDPPSTDIIAAPTPAASG